MEKTINYQLNQWAAGDKVQRIDFNADNAKIDAAIAAVSARADALGTSKADKTALSALQADLDAVRAAIPKIAVGSYAGDGAASRTIHLGFTPKAVLVITDRGRIQYNYSSSSYYTYGGLAVTGSPATGSYGDPIVTIQSGGFQVADITMQDSSHVNHYTHGNHSGQTYHYIALG